MPAIASIDLTGNPLIDGLLGDAKWASSSLTFSFPTDRSFYGTYGTGGEQANNFEAFTYVQQQAVRTILEMYASVANVTFSEMTETATEHADLRYAESDSPSTAWAYYPSISQRGGDAWFNNSRNLYDNPVQGNYAWYTMLHETGHAMGLDHGHEGIALPGAYDSVEYSVMSYRSFVGAGTNGVTNEAWGYPQTLMSLDVAALQELYGANYTTNSGDTVYRWDPTTGRQYIDGVAEMAPGGNRILMNVWDGGGEDTYDFSNYTTNLKVDLQPGAWTTVSTVQLAKLGSGHVASGNISNSLLYRGNTASLIENAIGGSGNDVIIGNQADNKLTGGGGADVLDGGSGMDIAVYSGISANYKQVYNADGTWTITDLREGSPDNTDTLVNIEFVQFSDRLVPLELLLLGAMGNDVLKGDAASNRAELIDGLAGSDKLYGFGGNDKLFGRAGNDLLDGGEGADVMEGGDDNDTYIVDQSGDLVIEASGEGSGIDTVIVNTNTFVDARRFYQLTANVENLTLGGDMAFDGAGNELANWLTGNAGANVLSGGAGNDTIYGNAGADILIGGEGNDNLYGGDDADVLEGGDGNDRLDGGRGDDIMRGGAGADTYTVDSVFDVVEEVDDGSIDTITSSVSFTLGAYVDNLTLSGAADLDGTGNDLANRITGNAGVNVLSGGAGNDTLYGNAGADTLIGGDGNDSLYGGDDADLLEGGDGNDRLDGGRGDDVMRGGAGADSYVVDSVFDVVEEVDDGSIDTVTSSVSFTLGAYLDNLTLGGAADLDGTGNELANRISGNAGANVLIGGAGNDTLSGNAGNDTLIGGEGNDSLSGGDDADFLEGGDGNDRLDGGRGDDVMRGGAGADTYVVDSLFDVVEEVDDGSIDSVTSSVSFTLGAYVDNLTLSGAADVDGTGNELANRLTGNAGANILSGGAGNDTLSGNAGNDTLIGGEGNDSLSGGDDADLLEGGDGNDRLDGGRGDDVMRGGAGADTYVVDSVFDVVEEVDDGSIDSVTSSVSFTLGAYLDNLTLGGAADLDGTGNELANRITGNAGANVLIGGAGNDTLSGNAGSDTLIGGEGGDTLYGGADGDLFVFVAPSPTSTDRVVDFSSAQGDRIGLYGQDFGLAVGSGLNPDGTLDGDYFGLGTSAGKGHAELFFNTSTKTLYWDADGVSGGSIALASFGAPSGTDMAAFLRSTDFVIL